jgi:hypothetical protein
MLLDVHTGLRTQLSLGPGGECLAVDMPIQLASLAQGRLIRLGPSGVEGLPKRAIDRAVAIILPLHQRSPCP